MNDFEDRYGHLWLHERGDTGRVIGSFHPVYCVSWHDATVDGKQAFGTILHEELHATALTTTFLHLALLRDFAATDRAFSDADFPAALADHITLHESLPKAHDVLAGTQISQYDDPTLVAAAETAARAVKLFCELVPAPGGMRGYDVLVLQAVYLAIGDAYNLDPRYTGSALLAMLEKDVRRRAGDLRSFTFDDAGAIREQVRYIFATLLRENGVRVVDMSTPYMAHQTFYVLAQLALRRPNVSTMNRILPSLITLWFGGPFSPHVVFNPVNKTANLITTLSAVVDTQRRAGTYDGAFLDSVEAASRAAMYNSPFDYIYRGYLHKCLNDVWHVPDGALNAYINLALGAFPSTLINILDYFVAPGVDYPERERVEHQMSEDDPAYEELLADYTSVRTLIWTHLSTAVPNAALTMVTTALDCIMELADNGEVPWPFDVAGLELRVGGVPYLTISG